MNSVFYLIVTIQFLDELYENSIFKKKKEVFLILANEMLLFVSMIFVQLHQLISVSAKLKSILANNTAL